MGLINLTLTKISIQKLAELKEKINIKSNLDIRNIEQEKIEFLKNELTLKISFKYDIVYEPKVAEISFEGFLLGTFEKEQIKEILKHWKKKQVLESIRLPVLNLIMNKCNIRALQLEEETGLPTHIPMPKLSRESENQNQGAGYVK